MFCPNCGTKNDDSALKCSQCGFDQKPKGPAPKHKGTVMMTGSPAANLGSDKNLGSDNPKPMPNLKGTMVGVAPPNLSSPTGAAKPAAAPAAGPAAKASAPQWKGTMVGVAPPGIDDLKKQAAASRAAPETAQPAAKSPPANLKGTMIGLAPPNMGAEVEAAKAKLAAKKAQAAEAAPITPEPSIERAASNPSAASKAPPSQLKGTMIGVAPPNVQAQIAAAKAAAARKDDIEPQQAPAQESDPPSEPDPLGGTVVGTSPFAPGGPHALQNPTAGALDFNDDTPPAGSGASAAMAEHTAAGQAPAWQAPAWQAPAVQAPAVQAPAVQTPAPIAASASEPSPHYSPAQQTERLPIKKSSTGPVLLLVVLLLVVALGVAFLLMGKGDTEESKTDDSKAEDGATAPAADATEK